MLKRAREVFDIEIKGLEAVKDSLIACGGEGATTPDNGAAFCEAIRMMLDCQAREGIVVVTGVGKNLHIAEKMSAIFSSTGTRSIVLNPVQAMHGDLGMVSAKDVLIALSFSGESAEVNNVIPAIRRHGLKVISMTRDPESTLAKLSDCHIAIPCGKEACPFGMAPTNSTTATMAMGDALAMVMIDAQEFKLESYAMNHPAGAIGRALVMKVTDIMRTGEKLAVVPPTATVLETVMAMTRAKGGAAAIADADGKLLGVFTDGDFRRVMSLAAEGSRHTQSTAAASAASSGATLSASIAEYMTRSPSFVYDDAYAAELLKIFEKKRIDDLPVCDRNGRVVGLVDIQDLPKMKVI